MKGDQHDDQTDQTDQTESDSEQQQHQHQQLQLRPSSPSSSRLSENIRSQYTREDQVRLARHLRPSVILNAADEAVYRIGRRGNGHLSTENTEELFSAPSSPRKSGSMDSRASSGFVSVPEREQERERERERARARERQRPERERGHQPSDSFYDCFRWLEEEEDLDLRLALDDYHANLRENLPRSTTELRPSFRRHLSITKIPFGRSSLSLSRPGTKDTAATVGIVPPTSPSSGPPGWNTTPKPPLTQQMRRRSRTLSLISPRLSSAPHEHTPMPMMPPFDPGAAHYQDPEARLKLRLYLASPQKFDEAVEFGFPSSDLASTSVSPVLSKEEASSKASRRQSRQSLLLDSASFLGTFLADDDDDDDDEDDYEDDEDRDIDDNDVEENLDDEDNNNNKSNNNSNHNIADSSDKAASKDSLAHSSEYSHSHSLRRAAPPIPESSRCSGRRIMVRPATGPSRIEHSRAFTIGGEEGAFVAPPPREMTIRMTLTRPDLRVDDEHQFYYGWQQQQKQSKKKHTSHKSMGMGIGVGLARDAVSVGGGDASNRKISMSSSDHWLASGGAGGGGGASVNEGGSGGAVKRFWNRVRRS